MIAAKPISKITQAMLNPSHNPVIPILALKANTSANGIPMI